MHREPDTGALRALTLIAESGSISAASAALGLSQQATSLRVRALEQDLGVPLLVRSARGSKLTDNGELVVGWSRPLLAAATEFGDAVVALRSGRGDSLRIAASLTIAEHLLPSCIASWRASQAAGTGAGTQAGNSAGEGRAGDASDNGTAGFGGAGAVAQLTAMNSEAVIAALRAGDADLGFVETPELPSDLSAVPVGRDRIEVIVAPNHPWANRTISAAELAATPMVLRETGSGTRLAFERALAAAGAPRTAEPAAVHETTLGARSAVIAGVAPGALSVLAVRDDLRSGRLARVTLEGLDITRQLTALWRGPGASAAARALLEAAARPVAWSD